MDRVPLLFTYLKRQVHFEEHVCTLAKYGLPNGLRASPKVPECPTVPAYWGRVHCWMKSQDLRATVRSTG